MAINPSEIDNNTGPSKTIILMSKKKSVDQDDDIDNDWTKASDAPEEEQNNGAPTSHAHDADNNPITQANKRMRSLPVSVVAEDSINPSRSSRASSSSDSTWLTSSISTTSMSTPYAPYFNNTVPIASAACVTVKSLTSNSSISSGPSVRDILNQDKICLINLIDIVIGESVNNADSLLSAIKRTRIISGMPTLTSDNLENFYNTLHHNTRGIANFLRIYFESDEIDDVSGLKKLLLSVRKHLLKFRNFTISELDFNGLVLPSKTTSRIIDACLDLILYFKNTLTSLSIGEIVFTHSTLLPIKDVPKIMNVVASCENLERLVLDVSDCYEGDEEQDTRFLKRIPKRLALICTTLPKCFNLTSLVFRTFVANGCYYVFRSMHFFNLIEMIKMHPKIIDLDLQINITDGENYDINSLDTWYVDHHVVVLADLLRNKKMRSLNLSNCLHDIPRVRLNILIRAIVESSSLRVIDLSNNDFEENDTDFILHAILTENTSLTSLALRNNDMDFDCTLYHHEDKSIVDISKCQLTDLDFSYNEPQKFSESIATNRGYRIHTEDVIEFFKIIMSLPCLRHLKLSSDHFSAWKLEQCDELAIILARSKLSTLSFLFPPTLSSYMVMNNVLNTTTSINTFEIHKHMCSLACNITGSMKPSEMTVTQFVPAHPKMRYYFIKDFPKALARKNSPITRLTLTERGIHTTPEDVLELAHAIREGNSIRSITFNDHSDLYDTKANSFKPIMNATRSNFHDFLRHILLELSVFLPKHAPPTSACNGILEKSSLSSSPSVPTVLSSRYASSRPPFASISFILPSSLVRYILTFLHPERLVFNIFSIISDYSTSHQPCIHRDSRDKIEHLPPFVVPATTNLSSLTSPAVPGHSSIPRLSYTPGPTPQTVIFSTLAPPRALTFSASSSSLSSSSSSTPSPTFVPSMSFSASSQSSLLSSSSSLSSSLSSSSSSSLSLQPIPFVPLLRSTITPVQTLSTLMNQPGIALTSTLLLSSSSSSLASDPRLASLATISVSVTPSTELGLGSTRLRFGNHHA